MDEFEKIKTFSESLAERQQKMTQTQPEPTEELDLPKYLSQFRAVPIQEEKESRRLLWVVLSLCILVAVGVVVALTRRLPEMEESEIIVISPTPTPVKVLPENPGGLNIPDKDKVVYNRAIEDAPIPVVESLFPEVEQPLLPMEMIEPENQEETGTSAKEQTPDQKSIMIEESLDIPLEQDVIYQPTPIEPEKQNVAVENIPMVPSQKPIEVQDVPPEKSEPIKEPVQEKTEPSQTQPVWRAQLLSSSSKAKVESSWKTISKTQASLLSDMPFQIVSATISGKGTFWRLQVGEFATKEMVINLCAKLKKKKQDCIPVK